MTHIRAIEMLRQIRARKVKEYALEPGYCTTLSHIEALEHAISVLERLTFATIV